MAWMFGGTISEGTPPPRTEIVYNVQPFRAADWKLIWRTPLPRDVELYNIAQDPSEKNNVARRESEESITASIRLMPNQIALRETFQTPLSQNDWRSILGLKPVCTERDLALSRVSTLPRKLGKIVDALLPG
jgi:hypothetical protein